MPTLLGYWHPGKHIAEVVYRVHLTSVLAPFMHAMYPNSTILKKPRFGVIMHLFVLIHYAYNEIRPNLHSAIKDPTLTTSQRTRLTSMRHLFEFYIPTCLWYMLAIRSKDKVLLKKAMIMLSIALITLESNIYLRAVFLSLSVRWHLMKSGHPASNIFEDPSLLNEEVGEISLSNLAQSLSRKQAKLNSPTETSMAYKLVGLARLACQDLNEELGFRSDTSLKEKRGLVDRNDARVPILVAKGTSLILDVRGQWKEYPALRGNVYFYQARNKIELVAGAPSRLILRGNIDINEIVDFEVEKLNTLFSPVARQNNVEPLPAAIGFRPALPVEYEITSHVERGGTTYFIVIHHDGRRTEHEEDDLDMIKLDTYWTNEGYNLQRQRNRQRDHFEEDAHDDAND